MKSKNLLKTVSVICIALLMEIGIFNFSNIVDMCNTKIEKNKIYTLENMELINWIQEDANIVSKVDPMLLLNDLNTEINDLQIRIKKQQPIPYVDIFYTDESKPNFNGELQVRYDYIVETDDVVTIKFNKFVKDLRIDLGDEEGLRVQEVEVIVNPVGLDFNISRVVAIVLIYVITKLLFKMQSKEDYEL